MLSDFRLALRTLAKSPTFVVVAVFTLALGIGVNTAMFSIVNAVMFRGLPFPDAERLIHVENDNLAEGDDSMSVSHADFADYRAGQQSFIDLAGYQQRTLNLSGPGGEPQRLEGIAISGSGMEMLGVPVHLGRWFTNAEDKPGAPAVVVLAHHIWRDRFKADPAVLGTPVKINAEWATVIGIGAPGFRFDEQADAWMPLRFDKFDEKRDNRYLEVFGRLKPGASLGQARAELQTVNQRLVTAYPGTNKGIGVVVKPLQEEMVGHGAQRMLLTMLGAVSLVLLIACANVANLLLARSVARQKEIAVRTALGAGRGRLIRLLLAESLLLSALGGLFGLGLAYGLMQVFAHYIALSDPPYWMVFSMDHRAVVYVGATVLAAGVLAGIFPALKSSRPDLTSVLKDGGRGSTGFSLSRFSRAMVIGEVALSMVLLVLSGLTVKSVINIHGKPLGYQTAGILTNRIGLPEADYKEVGRQIAFYDQFLDRINARPEVAAAAIASRQPTWGGRNDIVINGRKTDADNKTRVRAGQTAVSEKYFETLGIPILQGRAFDRRDNAAGARVVLVSAAFAEAYFPGGSPLGQQLRFGTPGDKEPGPWLTIIGVAGQTMQGDFDEVAPPLTYIPFAQDEAARFMTLFTKGRTGDPAALASTVRRTLVEQDNNLPIYWVQTLEEMVGQARFFKELFAWIFGVFGLVALVLAGVGLYGVVSYSVGQRTQEIGVRMALGASAGDVLKLIFGHSGRQLVIGMAIGLLLSIGGGKALAFVLFNVSATDPLTYALTTLVLGTAAFVATLVPALRALRVNPVEALRSE